MSQKIFSFSVSTQDTATLEFMAKLKTKCAKTGLSFTWVVIKALEQWEAQNEK